MQPQNLGLGCGLAVGGALPSYLCCPPSLPCPVEKGGWGGWAGPGPPCLRDGYESCQLLTGSRARSKSSSSKRYVQQMSLSTQTLFLACLVSWEIVPGHQGVVDLNLTNTCCLSQGCRTNGQDLHPAGRRCLLRHVIETVTASEINWAGPCLLISE